MLSEAKLAIKAVSPALLTGLRNQTGVKFSPADVERAKLYALTYTQPRPGVYRVGASIVDLWRPFCSCKAWRRQDEPKKPCVHFAALYLAGAWSPAYNPTEYFRSQGVEQPKIKGFYASVPCYQSRVVAEIYKTEKGTWLAELPSGEYWVIDKQEIKNVFPIYE